MAIRSKKKFSKKIRSRPTAVSDLPLVDPQPPVAAAVEQPAPKARRLKHGPPEREITYMVGKIGHYSKGVNYVPSQIVTKEILPAGENWIPPKTWFVTHIDGKRLAPPLPTFLFRKDDRWMKLFDRPVEEMKRSREDRFFDEKKAG